MRDLSAARCLPLVRASTVLHALPPATRYVLRGGSEVRAAAESAVGEAQKSQTVVLALGELRKEVGALAEGSQSIAVATLEAESAARQAQKGAEIISSAAEEQAAPTQPTPRLR